MGKVFLQSLGFIQVYIKKQFLDFLSVRRNGCVKLTLQLTFFLKQFCGEPTISDVVDQVFHRNFVDLEMNWVTLQNETEFLVIFGVLIR